MLELPLRILSSLLTLGFLVGSFGSSESGAAATSSLSVKPELGPLLMFPALDACGAAVAGFAPLGIGRGCGATGTDLRASSAVLAFFSGGIGSFGSLGVVSVATSSSSVRLERFLEPLPEFPALDAGGAPAGFLPLETGRGRGATGTEVDLGASSAVLGFFEGTEIDLLPPVSI